MINISKDTKKRAILPDNEAKWHVFYVQARHEKKAALQLEEDGFEVYLPIRRTLKLWSQRKKWVEEPYLKSYLFIRVSPVQLYDVLQHPKVLSYIRFNNQAAIVRDKEIELIKTLLKEDSTFNIEKKELNVGQKFTFESGPFKGHQGEITEKRSAQKLVVKMDQLDYQIVMDL